MTTYDKEGRPYAKLSKLKAGDIVELDEGFTCNGAGKFSVYRDCKGLYILCDEGHHYLYGQADDGEHLVGVYR